MRALTSFVGARPAAPEELPNSAAAALEVGPLLRQPASRGAQAGQLQAGQLQAGQLQAGQLQAGQLQAGQRQLLALFLPELLDELALERLPRARRMQPRAVVLVDEEGRELPGEARLDAVNAAARRAGVHPRQTIARAAARVENLEVCALPRARSTEALQQLAEVALAFGSPVSFMAPDIVWVDISGSVHLFGGVRALAAELLAEVRALEHVARVAIAPGPWLARAFAQHASFDETGICEVDAELARQQLGELPICALPVSVESVAWFSKLGLLTWNDLRSLPRASLAARLEGRERDRTLALLEGRDDGVLVPHVPEELLFEEQTWEHPIENVEPLLFVSKKLCARLGARLEGRGQAAQELLLTLPFDRASIDLFERERGARFALADSSAPPAAVSAAASAAVPAAAFAAVPPAASPLVPANALRTQQLRLMLAAPLAHPEDLERLVRSRLQRETLRAPVAGLRIEVTAITRARRWQLRLCSDAASRDLAGDPRSMAILIAELSADVGSDAVGKLEPVDSHLLEKSSGFVALGDISEPSLSGRPAPAGLPRAESAPPALCSAQLPTRLLEPIELEAPLKAKEVVVLERRAFMIESVRFEHRIESVEWWSAAPVSRDYYRLWLSAIPPASTPRMAPGGTGRSAGASRLGASQDGLEVLAYVDRADGRKYVQALYD